MCVIKCWVVFSFSKQVWVWGGLLGKGWGIYLDIWLMVLKKNKSKTLTLLFDRGRDTILLWRNHRTGFWLWTEVLEKKKFKELGKELYTLSCWLAGSFTKMAQVFSKFETTCSVFYNSSQFFERIGIGEEVLWFLKVWIVFGNWTFFDF
jgi:hypothetical protein